MDAQVYFDQYRDAVTEYAYAPRSGEPAIFSEGQGNLEARLQELRSRGGPFHGKFTVVEAHNNMVSLTDDRVNALLALEARPTTLRTVK